MPNTFAMEARALPVPNAFVMEGKACYVAGNPKGIVT